MKVFELDLSFNLHGAKVSMDCGSIYGDLRSILTLDRLVTV
jgi:hypothetical protein